MIAQLDRQAVREFPGRSAARIVSYLMFEGRPLTTKGQWWNPVTFNNLRLGVRVGKRSPTAPVFIIGMGRSGTTLLGRLLAVHPEVGFMNEPKALWHLVRSDEDVVGSYAPPETGRLYLDEKDATPAVQARARAMFGWFQTLSRSARVVDKYPELVFRRDFVRAIFPDARFLVATRGPERTLSSVVRWSQVHGDYSADWWGLRDQKWRIMWNQGVEAQKRNADLRRLALGATEDDLLRAAVEWIVTMREATDAAGEDDTKIVSYERLVASPAEEMAHILDFCGLETSPATLAYAAKTVEFEGDAGDDGLAGLPQSLAQLVDETRAGLARAGGCALPEA
jgi:hypothetical protein